MATTCKLIAKNVLGSDAANVEFTSIPSTYDDLFLVATARTSRSAANENLKMTVNGSGSGYSERLLYGDGSSAASASRSAQSSLIYIYAAGNTQTSNTFGSVEIYIPNYAGSTNKSMSITSCNEGNAATVFALAANAALWADTAAITSIKIETELANDLKSGSSFFLYGIKKA
jgi:hypothetical protein